MNFETERLIIRKLRAGDLDDFHAYRSDPVVCLYQGYEPSTREQCRAYIAQQRDVEFGTAHQWAQLGIELKSENKLIGDIGLKPEHDPRIVEFGISMSRDHQGQGLASEALAAVFDHLFTEKEVHRIIALMDAGNSNMSGLAERLGLRREGHYIQAFFDNGEWRDEYFYALLEEEWRRK